MLWDWDLYWKQKLKVNIAVPNLTFSFITSSCKRTLVTRGQCVCVCLCACLRLAGPASPTVGRALAFDKAPGFTLPPSFLPLHRISISSWFHKHYKWHSMGATDCASLSFSLSPAPLPLFLCFLLTLTLVSWDRVARETRPHGHGETERVQNIALLCSDKGLLHFNCTYRPVIWEIHITMLNCYVEAIQVALNPYNNSL